MARDIIERELNGRQTGRARFAVAGEADDADIRSLLRRNPMRGRISVSLEREPDYFADARLPGELKQTIVAREGDRVVCAGSCTIRRLYVNGEPRRVGYLGGLRLDEKLAGRFDIVRRGYDFFHELQADAPADYYFTSIATDNEAARRFLERGLPGMPRYESVNEFVTLLLPARHRHGGKRAPGKTTLPDDPSDRSLSSPEGGEGWGEEASNFSTQIPSPLPSPRLGGEREAGAGPRRAQGETTPEERVALINEHNSRYQFAPCWSAGGLAALKSLGLGADDFRFVRAGDTGIAGGGLWDQSGFKQTVIRDYAPPLSMARPAINFFARIAGGVRLPARGEILRNAFISHLVAPADEPEALIEVISELRSLAFSRGVELLTMGFAAADPRLAAVRRRFRCREYSSRLYVVNWPGCGGSAADLDGRIPAPEVAWL